MTNCMNTSSSNDESARSRKAGKPEPGSREERLAEALRQNLRRRKSAAKKPSGAADGTETTAQTAPEKPGNRS
jgi:hypothetical protein